MKAAIRSIWRSAMAAIILVFVVCVMHTASAQAMEIQYQGRYAGVTNTIPGYDTMEKGRSYNIRDKWGDALTFMEGSVKETFNYWDDGYTVSSSDPAVLEVSVTQASMAGSPYQSYTLVPAGGGQCEVYIDVVKGALAGKRFTIQMTVTSKESCPGTTLRSQGKANHSLFYFENEIDFKILREASVEYELYRSTSKDSGYKLVKTFTGSNHSDFGETYGTVQDGDNANKLKANTRYYYKIRARYTDPKYDNTWSEFSSPVSYYTAAKPLAKSKYSYSESTHRLKITKVTGAKGYIYRLRACDFIGYNVFGQSVMFSEEQNLYTSKTNFITKKKVQNHTAYTVNWVIPVTKHGDYYYANGYKPVKKTSAYKSEVETDKRAI